MFVILKTIIVARINAIVKNKIYYSKKAVECDYFAVLFGKDEVK